MKKAVCFAMVLAMLALMALGGCTAGEKELRKVKLNEVTRSVFYAPLYCAVTIGYFEKEGMEVEIVTSGGSDKSMTALISGDADVALMGPETGIYVVNQGLEGHPMIVAQITKRDGSFLVGRSEEPDFDWENLRGCSIVGGRPGGMPFMTLCYVLKSHGLVPGEDVEVIDNIQFPLMGGAFEGGTGDYVTLFEPTASEFASSGRGYIVANVGLESGEVPYTTIMMSQNTIDNEPEFAQSFVNAIYAAQQWVMSASDEDVAKAMQPFFPDSSIETLASVAKSYRATDSWMYSPAMSEDAFNRLQDIIETAGELSQRVEFAELVNNTFADRAMGK